MGFAALLAACSGNEPEPQKPASVSDAAPEADAAVAPACVVSPAPAPWPTGACEVPSPPAKDALDEALGLVGLDRCTLGFDPKDVPKSGWNPKDPRRLPDFEPLLMRPLRLPSWGRETARWLDDAVASSQPVSRAIAAAAVRRGAPVGSCPDAAWFVVDAADPSPLVTAIVAATAEHGGAADPEALRAAAQGVPIELQRALAPIVRALGHAAREVVEARGTTDPKLLNSLQHLPSWVIGTRTQRLDAAFLGALDGVDVGRMTAAAVALATAIEAADLARFAGVDVPPFEADTPFGAIVLRSAQRDEHLPGGRAEAAALLVDTGGDDVYRVPVGGASLARPVAVAIDLGGDDLYGYVEKPTKDDAIGVRLPSDGAARATGRSLSRVTRQGAGVLGVGLLYDLGAGKDVYRSLAVSQGAASLGVGVLFDDGGDDTYTSEAFSQGAAAFGVGLLLDRAGDDRYTGYSQIQGFGFTGGVGGAVDLAGNDRWYADPGDPALGGDPLYPSAQLPGKGNTSLAQGCGFGRRWDTTAEKVGFLGGLGLLRDAVGDDEYVASVFAQGCGFLGTGALLEGGGDDRYEGLWYVQGSTAHLGVALFHDAAGNDRYDETFPIAATSIGVGHDFSVSVLLDEGGDDAYHGPNLALGSGHANGLGLLVNVGGVDVFRAKGPFSLGGAAAGEVYAGPRGALPPYGVFVKAGGASTYDAPSAGPAPGGTWSYAPENVPDAGADAAPPDATFHDGAAKSVGVDRPAGAALLP